MILDKKSYFIQCVKEAAKVLGLKKVPRVKIWDGACPYSENEIAHAHPDLNLVCISKGRLESMNFDEIKETAFHETTHMLHKNHDIDFGKTMDEALLANWLENRKPKKINLSHKKEKKADRERCNYHLCRKKAKLYKCKYCGDYFCKDHIKPKMVVTLNQISRAKEPLRSWLEKEYREEGHPDLVYTRMTWEELEKREKEELEKRWEALNRLKEIPKTERIFEKSEEITQEEHKTEKESEKKKIKTIRIPLEEIILTIFILGFAWYVYNNFQHIFVVPAVEETTTTTQPSTTTTLRVKRINVDLNFSTPTPRLNKSCFITNQYFVYINDSLLRIIDPDFSKNIYNSTINVTKTAFKIWEDETKLVHFGFVGPDENYTIYVEFTAEMPLTAAEKEFVAYALGYAIPYGYECGNYWFGTGGKIYISPKESSRVFAIALHEIGHILNLADVGNADSVMYAWQEESTFSEQIWREKITKEIKDTLKMIVKPEYDCMA